MVPNPELDDLDLNDLADRLASVQTTRTNEGFQTESAVLKSGLERRILNRVRFQRPEDTSKLAIDHSISLSVQDKQVDAESAEIRSGGLVIPANSRFEDGATGFVEIKTDNDFPLRVKCVIRELDGVAGVGVAFEGVDDAYDRRVSRLILELLKNKAE